VDPNPFTAVDRDLLRRCLSREPGSWNDFVDRFLSLIYHVIGYTAHLRSVRLNPQDVEDIASEILLKVVANDFRVLREFREDASLATYLTVISRRICIQQLVQRQRARDAVARGEVLAPQEEPDDAPVALKGIESLEEVEKLLRRLSGKEREIVRLYYLEGRTYEEISTQTEVPVNSVGSILSRARKKLRGNVKKTGGVDSLSAAVHSPPPPPPPPPVSAPPPPQPPSSATIPIGKLVAPPPGTGSGTHKPVKPAKPSKPAKPNKEKRDGE
jgi:RNA polymerase sigma-70 factor (ECF subfamily)